MWNITPDDIKAAKHAWGQRRDDMIARHQEEVRALENDFRLISTVEGSAKAFTERFKTITVISDGKPGSVTKEPAAGMVEEAAGLTRRLVGEMIARDGVTESPNFAKVTPTQ